MLRLQRIPAYSTQHLALSYLHLNTQSLSWENHKDEACPKAQQHHHDANLIWTVHLMILKQPQNGSLNFDGHLYLRLSNVMCVCVVQIDYCLLFPQHGNFELFGCKIQQGTLEVFKFRPCTSQFYEPTRVEKTD